MTARPLLLALVVLLAAGCGESSGQPRAGAKAAPSGSDAVAPTVISPEYQTRMAMMETTGKVQFNEDTLVRVHAPATGRVLEVFARPGDVVERGGRLMVLDSADLGAAKADYAKAVADLEHAEAALRLTRELFEVKAVAQKEIRDAEAEASKAAAERERAAARLETLGVGRDHLKEIATRAGAGTTITLVAPRSGVVVERNVTPGQVVAFGQSDTPVNLFVIADLSTVWVVADVYEPDVPHLRRGETMTVTLPCCPEERYEGTVGYISDMVDKDTRTVKVRAVVPNRGRALKAEMFVRATIATGSRRVLTIPQAAVHREGGETFVLVVTGADARARRPVRLGADFGDSVEVLGGLTPEDRVVARGSILLKSGTQ